MRRSRISYLESRPSGFYFRFQIPSQFRLTAGRSCVRVCLHTCDRGNARDRIAAVLPHVYLLKRLCKGRKMTSDEYRRALSFAVKRIVETLESWDEPWRDGDDRARIPEYLEWKLLKETFDDWPDVRPALLLESDANLRSSMLQGQPTSGERPVKESSGSLLARIVLKQLGINAAQDSKVFADLTVEMEKVQLGVHRVMEGRSNGDAAAQERFKAYYRRLGHLPSEQEPAFVPTPQISVAWKDYSSEKMSGPKPAWTDKTARSQHATLAEFCEIVGDIPIREITRDVMLQYRNVVARLPSNRQIDYADAIEVALELILQSISRLDSVNLPRCRPAEE